MAPNTKTSVRGVNVLPDWWTFVYLGLQLSAMLPLAYKSFFTPVEAFLRGLPKGYDPATDKLIKSLRHEMHGILDSSMYLMVMVCFMGNVLIARNAAKGHPKLQQTIVRLPLLVGLASDIWVFSTIIFKFPSDLLKDPSRWPSATKMAFTGIPVVSIWKLIWLFGIGRDKV